MTPLEAIQAQSQLVRTTDGTYVREGAVTSESPLARLWRWPTRFLNDTQARYFGDFAALIFWLVAAWLAWRLVKTFR